MKTDQLFLGFCVGVAIWGVAFLFTGILPLIHDFADNHPWLYLAVAGVVALLATLKVLHIL